MNIKYQPLLDFLSDEKIEYAAVLPFSALKVYNKAKLTHINFTPLSAVIMLLPYYDGYSSDCNISLYAVPRDYHLYFQQLSKRLQLRFSDNGISVCGFADSSPIDERDAAVKAGLGVIGDNHLLINHKYGSYIFIGSFLFDTDAALLADTITFSENHGCCHCGRCTAACPSPNNCLSAITQKKGELSQTELELISAHKLVWGCDICQQCCPMNSLIPHTPIDFFRQDKIYCLNRHVLDNMSNEEFKSRAFSWRGRTVLERNLKIIDPVF